MTNLEAIKFAAEVTVGTKIKANNMVMVVTEIGKASFKGYSEYVFNKFGKKNEMMLSFNTLLNPHYNKNIAIV